MTTITIPGADTSKASLTAPNGVWRRLVKTKIAKIRGMPVDEGSACPEDVSHRDQLLCLAGQVAETPETRQTRWSGELCDQAWRLVHEAEAYAVAMLPTPRRVARMREMLFDAASILDPHDPLLQLKPGQNDGDDSPDKARELVLRYRQRWDDRYTRSRNYRNRLRILIGVVTLFVGVLVVVGGLGLFSIEETTRDNTGTLMLVWPTWEPSALHFVAMIAIGTLGSIGGLLAGARQVTQIGGVYNPFFLPLHSLILKIQMGALCALAGIVALLGGLAPEIKAGRWGDVAVWALIFGAAQQLVTQLVDRKVNALVTSEPRAQEEKK